MVIKIPKRQLLGNETGHDEWTSCTGAEEEITLVTPVTHAEKKLKDGGMFGPI